MRKPVTRIAAVLVLSIVASACGDDSGTPTPDGSEVETEGSAEPSSQLDDAQLAAACDALITYDLGVVTIDGLSDQDAETVDDLASWSAALEELFESEPESSDTPAAAPAAIFEVLEAADIADRLHALSAGVTSRCEDTSADEGVLRLAQTAEFLEPESSPEYCDALAPLFAPEESDTSTEVEEAQLAALTGSAPPEHADTIAMLVNSDEGDPEEFSVAFLDIAYYAEGRCDITGALALGFLVGAFASMSDEADGSGANALPTGGVPDDIEQSALDELNALVPETRDLVFESRVVAVDDDDEFLVAVPVPIGWEETAGFRLSIEPSAGSDLGFFTEMSVDAACNGICEPSDWETRHDEFVSDWAETPLTDEALTDPPGRVTVAESSGVPGTTIYVPRWNDDAPRYMLCTVDLDEDDADLVDVMREACLAASPGWF